MRVKAFGRWLFRALFRRGWLSSRVESEPLVEHLRAAVEESRQRQDRPFELEAADNEEHETEYRLPRILNNRDALYVACILLGVALFLILNLAFNVQPHDVQFGTVLAFVTSVIAIGLPLVTAFGAFRRSGRWAEDYLFGATHLAWFTRETCVAAAVGLLSVVVAPLGSHGVWASGSISLLTGCAWGFALATLVYLTAVVLEIIHCSRSPHFACAASANMLSERLLNGFLRNAYLAAFLQAHEDHLERFCRGLQHVDGPGEYMLVHYRADDEKQRYEELKVPLRRFVIERQFLDYYVPGLKKLDRLVAQAGSRLCLTPHNWTRPDDGRTSEIGLLLPPPTTTVRAKARWFRPRSDFCPAVSRHSQEDLQNLFLYEVSLRLADFDTRGYRLDLAGVRRAALEFAKVWADPEVREQFRPGREEAGKRAGAQGISFVEVYDWLWLHVRLLNQILHHTPRVERTPYLETRSFVRCHENAYQDLLEECVSLGNAEMFGLLLRLLPYFYNAVDRFCKWERKRLEPAGEPNTESLKEALEELWDMRAKWGFVYELPSAILRDLPSGLDPDVRWRFLLFLHQFACVWIRKAKQAGDGPLVNNLAEGIANVMQMDAEWREDQEPPAEADLLMARHWLILGESLREALSQKGQISSPLSPDELTPEFLQEQEPEQLLRFYANHRRVDEGERGFEDLRPELSIPMRPLGGGGVGEARWVPQHEEEMHLAFLWLLLMHPEPPQPLLAIPVDVAGPAIRTDLQRILSKFTQHPGKHRIWRLPPEGQKHWIEEWLEECAAAQAAQRRTDIAEAPVDTARANEFQDKFRENFRNSLVLSQFLLDVGAYEVQEEIEALEPKTLVPKTAVIAPPLGFGETLGDDFGSRYGHGLDMEFVRTLLKAKETPTKMCADDDKGIREAAAWLKKQGSTGNQGLICVLGRSHAGSLLLNREDFIPAWKEAVGVEGFEGRFKGFPVWQGRLEQEAKVLAVDLRNARPLCVRPRALRGEWADVSLRELTADQLDVIRKAREDQDKPFEELREKQNCVADISVYARFQPPEPQQLNIIPIEQAEENPQTEAAAEQAAPDEEGP